MGASALPFTRRRHPGFDFRFILGDLRLGARLVRKVFFEEAKKYKLSMIRRSIRVFLAICGTAFAFDPSAVLACAACFGKSDSPLAQGMNWGILSLLVVVGLVLGGIASFFIYLAKRSALAPDAGTSEATAETTQKV
jgi:hypothetical protein